MRMTRPQFQATVKRVVREVTHQYIQMRHLNLQDKATVVEYEHAWRTGNKELALKIRIANRDLARMFTLAELGGLS